MIWLGLELARAFSEISAITLKLLGMNWLATSCGHMVQGRAVEIVLHPTLVVFGQISAAIKATLYIKDFLSKVDCRTDEASSSMQCSKFSPALCLAYERDTIVFLLVINTRCLSVNRCPIGEG
jgi:hypothetical protein